jgi:hypothetical protein
MMAKKPKPSQKESLPDSPQRPSSSEEAASVQETPSTESKTEETLSIEKQVNLFHQYVVELTSGELNEERTEGAISDIQAVLDYIINRPNHEMTRPQRKRLRAAYIALDGVGVD